MIFHILKQSLIRFARGFACTARVLARIASAGVSAAARAAADSVLVMVGFRLFRSVGAAESYQISRYRKRFRFLIKENTFCCVCSPYGYAFRFHVFVRRNYLHSAALCLRRKVCRRTVRFKQNSVPLLYITAVSYIKLGCFTFFVHTYKSYTCIACVFIKRYLFSVFKIVIVQIIIGGFTCFCGYCKLHCSRFVRRLACVYTLRAYAVCCIIGRIQNRIESCISCAGFFKITYLDIYRRARIIISVLKFCFRIVCRRRNYIFSVRKIRINQFFLIICRYVRIRQHMPILLIVIYRRFVIRNNLIRHYRKPRFCKQNTSHMLMLGICRRAL